MGGIPEFVSDGVNGLLFDGRDGDDLARQLDRLAQRAGPARAAAGRASRRRAAFADYVDELEAYYARRAAAPRATTGVAPVSLRWQGDHGSTQSLSIINRRVCDRLAEMDGVALERVSRTGAGARAGPAAAGRGRGAPPVAARPAPAGVRPPGRDPALGVRRGPGRVGRRASTATSTSCGCRARTCATSTSAPASTPSGSRSIPNGVDLELFSPDGPRMRARRCRAMRFLFVGGLIDRKGPDVLLAACPRRLRRAATTSRSSSRTSAPTASTATSDRTRLREYAAVRPAPAHRAI